MAAAHCAAALSLLNEPPNGILGRKRVRDVQTARRIVLVAFTTEYRADNKVQFTDTTWLLPAGGHGRSPVEGRPSGRSQWLPAGATDGQTEDEPLEPELQAEAGGGE